MFEDQCEDAICCQCVDDDAMCGDHCYVMGMLHWRVINHVMIATNAMIHPMRPIASTATTADVMMTTFTGRNNNAMMATNNVNVKFMWSNLLVYNMIITTFLLMQSSTVIFELVCDDLQRHNAHHWKRYEYGPNCKQFKMFHINILSFCPYYNLVPGYSRLVGTHCLPNGVRGATHSANPSTHYDNRLATVCNTLSNRGMSEYPGFNSHVCK